jgi:hypothetical protein
MSTTLSFVINVNNFAFVIKVKNFVPVINVNNFVPVIKVNNFVPVIDVNNFVHEWFIYQDLERIRRESASPKDLEKAEAKLRKSYDEYKNLLEKYNGIREEFERCMTVSCKVRNCLQGYFWARET